MLCIILRYWTLIIFYLGVHGALLRDIKTDLKDKGRSNTSNSQGAISGSIKLWDTDKLEQFEQNFDPIIVREIDQKLNILQTKPLMLSNH